MSFFNLQLHHPGSKKQYEEVWEKQDHLEDQEFDVKTFFYLHGKDNNLILYWIINVSNYIVFLFYLDLDGNGVWDQNELKGLFQKELDKLYQSGHPEDDMVERQEEMERMREHVMRETDLNKDGLIR